MHSYIFILSYSIECKYSKKADWSSCVNGEMTRTLKLKGGKAVSGCEATKVDKKPCK